MVSQYQTKASSLKPFLNHAGDTQLEQIEKNQNAIELLETWLSEEVPSIELEGRKSYLTKLKQMIDSQRLSVSSLDSAE